MTQKILYPHQQKILDSAPDKIALWLRPRVGKTPLSIRLASTRSKRALVCCPKSIKNQWSREIMLWNNSNTEFFVRSRDDIRLMKNIPKDIDCVIWDEVQTAGSNYKSQTYKSMQSIIAINNPKYIWLLSGTPATSNLGWAVYSYGKLLGRDWKWQDWNRHFYDQIKMGGRRVPVLKKKLLPELDSLLRKIGILVDLKDITEVLDDVDIIEEFSLTAEQKRLIKDSYDPLPVVRYSHQHSLEQGTLKSDGYSQEIVIPVDKDKRLLELINQQPKTVVVCRFLLQIDKLAKLISDTGKKVYVISGQIKEEAGDIAIKANADPNCVVICQSDTGVGYSLSDFDTMIFASMSYSFVCVDQMKSRIKAIGKKTPCEYIYMLTEGKSLDRAVYDCIQTKQDFAISLYKK